MLTILIVVKNYATTTEFIDKLLTEARDLIPSQINSADSLATHALDLSILEQNDSLIARSYYLLGVTNYYRSNYLRSTNFYTKALTTEYADHNIEFASWCYNNLGINYEIDANYVAATDAYLQSLKLAEILGDSLGKYQTYINVGFLYSRIKDFTVSERYLFEALKFFTRTNDTLNQALCYQNIGILYNDKSMEQNALEYYEKAVEMYKQLGDERGVLQNKINEISTLLDIDQLSDLPYALQQTMEMAIKTDDQFLQALVHNLYGRYYLKIKKYLAAEQSLHAAEKSFRALGASGKIRYIYLLFIDLYRQTGQESLFHESLEKYDQITHRIFDEETAAKIADYNAIYESEKKAAQILVLDHQLRQRENILTLWVSISLLLLVSVITISVLYLNYRRKQKSLYQRNEEIMAIMDQNDGVGNHETEILQAPNEHHKELKLFKEIKETVITKKLWENPGLKVADLSMLLFTNDKYISSAISVGNKSNFNHFINTFRINAAKKLLANEYNDRLTYVQIADKVGFSNEYTFQKKFKELTGLTPHTYKKMGKVR